MRVSAPYLHVCKWAHMIDQSFNASAFLLYERRHVDVGGARPIDGACEFLFTSPSLPPSSADVAG